MFNFLHANTRNILKASVSLITPLTLTTQNSMIISDNLKNFTKNLSLVDTNKSPSKLIIYHDYSNQVKKSSFVVEFLEKYLDKTFLTPDDLEQIYQMVYDTLPNNCSFFNKNNLKRNEPSWEALGISTSFGKQKISLIALICRVMSCREDYHSLEAFNKYIKILIKEDFEQAKSVIYDSFVECLAQGNVSLFQKFIDISYLSWLPRFEYFTIEQELMLIFSKGWSTQFRGWRQSQEKYLLNNKRDVEQKIYTALMFGDLLSTYNHKKVLKEILWFIARNPTDDNLMEKVIKRFIMYNEKDNNDYVVIELLEDMVKWDNHYSFKLLLSRYPNLDVSRLFDKVLSEKRSHFLETLLKSNPLPEKYKKVDDNFGILSKALQSENGKDIYNLLTKHGLQIESTEQLLQLLLKDEKVPSRLD